MQSSNTFEHLVPIWGQLQRKGQPRFALDFSTFKPVPVPRPLQPLNYGLNLDGNSVQKFQKVKIALIFSALSRYGPVATNGNELNYQPAGHGNQNFTNMQSVHANNINNYQQNFNVQSTGQRYQRFFITAGKCSILLNLISAINSSINSSYTSSSLLSITFINAL